MPDNKIKHVNQRRISRRYVRLGVIALGTLTVLFIILRLFGVGTQEYQEKTGNLIEDTRPEMTVDLLTVNPYSRPGTSTTRIEGIVMHYTANPGASAQNNRDYFEGLKDSHITQASSHFIIGLEGEIIQCVPTWEVAYASNSRNLDTVSIECCHPDESGAFDDATYQSMIELTAWLCLKFDLTEKDVSRHYDITGKNCPKYFVENEESWETFRTDVKKALEEMGN